jgi:FixJ family two-component response regulator
VRYDLSKKPVIAVVDDDQSVREALTGLLRSVGYGTVAFERAEDLLSSERRPAISCVIADVQMPGMTGPELHQQLTTSAAPIPTILITGYPEDTARDNALLAGVTCYLAKPFNEQDLLACIHSALGCHDLIE